MSTDPTGPRTGTENLPERLSLARVASERPARYGHQLVRHMARKVEGDWDESGVRGRLTFAHEGRVTGVLDLSCEDGALVMALRASPSAHERLEQVVGIHLARFGWKEGLAVAWEREDGSPGTRQGPLTEEDMERLRRERQARQSAPAEQGG